MEAAIFDDLTALADATRSRMLLVLEKHELTVGEMCSVLQLPQSTVSRHLKTLLTSVGELQARWHQPLLLAGARRADAVDAPPVDAPPRIAERPRRAPSRMRGV